MTSDDVRRRDALERTVSARLMTCSLDELRVMDFVLGRLEFGRDQYGLLKLAGDKRNFRRELAEEMGDAIVYVACGAIVEHDKRVEAILAQDEPPTMSVWEAAAQRARTKLTARLERGHGTVAEELGIVRLHSYGSRGRFPLPEVAEFVHSMATAGDEVAPPSAVTDPERAAGDPERAPLTNTMHGGNE